MMTRGIPGACSNPEVCKIRMQQEGASGGGTNGGGGGGDGDSGYILSGNECNLIEFKETNSGPTMHKRVESFKLKKMHSKSFLNSYPYDIDTFPNRLLTGEDESNPITTCYQEDDHHFPSVAYNTSYVDIHLKLCYILYEMKKARYKKGFQDSDVKPVSAVTPKFNGSKVSLMKFRNSLFLNDRSVDKRQRYQFVKCPKLSVSYSCNNENLKILFSVSFSSAGLKKCSSLKSFKCEFDDYSRIETENISYILPWSVPNKSMTDPNKLAKSGDVESNPGPTPTNSFASLHDKSLDGFDNENRDDLNVDLFLNVKTVKFEKCPQLNVSCSSKQDTLNTSGVSFRSDCQKKSAMEQTVSNGKIDDSVSNCMDTDPDKLLKSGDVESNPGPTPVNKDSQKGRPKKKRF